MYEDVEIIAGLDMGTSKIAVVVAERGTRSGDAQIIGVGCAPSRGIRKGVIVNLEQAAESVRHAVADAEAMIGLSLRGFTVTTSGSEVSSIRSKGMISLGRAPRQVTEHDLERVIEAALSDVVVPSNHCSIHVVPVGFAIDGQKGIDDPLGMTGIRLEAEVQSVVVPMAVVQNVINCVEMTGYAVTGLVLKPLASALGVLSIEEAIAGTAVVDAGGGTTSISVYSEGSPRKLGVIPVGGDHITNDIACTLKIPISRAEEIKKAVSLVEEGEVLEDELEFEVRGKSYSCTVGEVLEVIACRMEELFGTLIRRELEECDVSLLPGGIVLTGGVSLMPGLDEYVAELLDCPVRVAPPLDEQRMPPGKNDSSFASAAGIVRYVLEKERNPFRYLSPSLEFAVDRSIQKSRKSLSRSREAVYSVQKAWGSIKKSLKELF